MMVCDKSDVRGKCFENKTKITLSLQNLKQALSFVHRQIGIILFHIFTVPGQHVKCQIHL